MKKSLLLWGLLLVVIISIGVTLPQGVNAQTNSDLSSIWKTLINSSKKYQMNWLNTPSLNDPNDQVSNVYTYPSALNDVALGVTGQDIPTSKNLYSGNIAVAFSSEQYTPITYYGIWQEETPGNVSLMPINPPYIFGTNAEPYTQGARTTPEDVNVSAGMVFRPNHDSKIRISVGAEMLISSVLNGIYNQQVINTAHAYALNSSFDYNDQNENGDGYRYHVRVNNLGMFGNNLSRLHYSADNIHDLPSMITAGLQRNFTLASGDQFALTVDVGKELSPINPSQNVYEDLFTPNGNWQSSTNVGFAHSLSYNSNINFYVGGLINSYVRGVNIGAGIGTGNTHFYLSYFLSNNPNPALQSLGLRVVYGLSH